VHRIVAITPAGRRQYLEILDHYIRGDDAIVEWRLYDNCRNAEDRAYLSQLAAANPKARLFEVAGADGTNRSINSIYTQCREPDVFYIKMDDDIVYLDPGFASRMYAAAMRDPDGPVWWSPLVINNAICSFLIKHTSGMRIDAPLSAQASCSIGWRDPRFAEAMHTAFTGALAQGVEARFHCPDTTISGGRFSINCIGFFGRTVAELGNVFCPPGVDDEEWISAVLPAKTQRHGLVIGDLLAAHFAYFTQADHLDSRHTLGLYSSLIGQVARTATRGADA
jgi:hypothetical protein